MPRPTISPVSAPITITDGTACAASFAVSTKRLLELVQIPAGLRPVEHWPGRAAVEVYFANYLDPAAKQGDGIVHLGMYKEFSIRIPCVCAKARKCGPTGSRSVR